MPYVGYGYVLCQCSKCISARRMRIQERMESVAAKTAPQERPMPMMEDERMVQPEPEEAEESEEAEEPAPMDEPAAEEEQKPESDEFECIKGEEATSDADYKME